MIAFHVCGLKIPTTCHLLSAWHKVIVIFPKFNFAHTLFNLILFEIHFNKFRTIYLICTIFVCAIYLLFESTSHIVCRMTWMTSSSLFNSAKKKSYIRMSARHMNETDIFEFQKHSNEELELWRHESVYLSHFNCNRLIAGKQ